MKKVLVVDDSQISCLVTQAIIQGHYPDWEVLLAYDALEAIALTQEHSFDYITLDMNMPGRDGLSVAPELMQASPNAVIALLTGVTQERVRERAEELGLIFISKPVTDLKILEFFKQYE